MPFAHLCYRKYQIFLEKNKNTISSIVLLGIICETFYYDLLLFICREYLKKHTNWYFFACKKPSFAIKYTYPYLSLYITKIKWFQSTVLQALSLKKRISTYKRKNLNNVFRCCHRKLHWYKRKREKNKNVKNSCALLLTNWEKKN